jgi:hypothetical protein
MISLDLRREVQGWQPVFVSETHLKTACRQQAAKYLTGIAELLWLYIKSITLLPSKLNLQLQ